MASAVALDDRIDDIAELVQKHYGVADLGDPSAETEVLDFVFCINVELMLAL